MSSTSWTRRRFAQMGLCGAAAYPLAASWAATRPEHWIELLNTHTSEVISVVFADAGGFIATALARLEYFLRDFRVAETHPIDTGLYLQLAQAARREPRFEVISGYRSPATNASLREAGHAVSAHSLHVEGRAIDVRLHGCASSRLRDFALQAAQGGVGFYPREDFVHLDTGRVRAWQA